MAGGLSSYKRKRDFARTAEPAGDRAIDAAEYPRFVIQKHDARRLHYDLRLEVAGTFRSWAVTRGPSLNPADKRLAVEVEDHPLDYGDFEGTIPAGEYGGGTVMIWDRGFWTADNGPADAALAKGELKFTLGGSKVKGNFVLVRMARDRTGGGRTNWLLIKHKDEWAKPADADALPDADRSIASGRTMAEIAKGKPPKPEPFMGRTGKARSKSRGTPAAAMIAAPRVDGDHVEGIKITHPERLVWPEPAITKLELAKFIASVAPFVLSHVAGRPCSVVRAPDGIEGSQFFQRHVAAGMPKDIAPFPVRGEKEPYIRADTVGALVALVQFGSIEFHPWNCASGAPEEPGRLVFDLDPAPDVDFDRVIDAARTLKDRLTRLDLVPFCKTTGGKGLHVVVPLSGGKRMSWDDAKTFAHAVCQQMADAEPNLYLTSMSKKRRTGRIFLDYLRNERSATAVAPLSPRARPGATVSMPLNWPQVRAGLDPGKFTVLNAAAQLKRSRAWADYDKSARPLDAAIRALLRDAT